MSLFINIFLNKRTKDLLGSSLNNFISKRLPSYQRTTLLFRFQSEAKKRGIFESCHISFFFDKRCLASLYSLVYKYMHNLWSDFSMFLALAILSFSVYWGECDKVSPKPGLKLFQEDYKSVEETCIAVGFVKNRCRNDTKMGIYIIHYFRLSLTFSVHNTSAFFVDILSWNDYHYTYYPPREL